MNEESPVPPDNEFDVVVTVGDDAPIFEFPSPESVTIAELTAQVAILTERVTALRSEQIDGSDQRLANFWSRAQELADRAGHCDVFDDIAEALGGPGREAEFEVTISVSACVTVTARDKESAEESACEIVSNDPSDYFDIGNADYYTEQV